MPSYRARSGRKWIETSTAWKLGVLIGPGSEAELSARYDDGSERPLNEAEHLAVAEGIKTPALTAFRVDPPDVAADAA